MRFNSKIRSALGAAVLAAPLAVLILAPEPALAGADGIGPENMARLQAAIAGDHREAMNRSRDIHRHPAETLAFFGLKPEMTVVEVYPGGGWYTEVLAPYLKGAGHLYAASWDAASKSESIQRRLKKFHDKLAARSDIYSGVTVTELSPAKTEIAPAGSADMVLTFRNIHNWMKGGFDRTVFEAMYRALKPGGVLGIVEHRADPEAWPDPQALSGYVHQDIVVDLATAVGFKLVATSEINANSKDTRNYPEGVWTLPPVLRLKDKDRSKYLAIGESDRMTLKFVRPM